jgi:hypothetical protein
MTGLLDDAARVLRGTPPGPGRVLALVLLTGFLYGGAMGSYGGLGGDRPWQVVYSAVKVPLLLWGTFLLALPSFFVLNTLLGVRGDFGQVVRALVGCQVGLTVVLAALAPYTLLWYASFNGYHEAILFNALMFAVASVAAQQLLWRSYRPLIACRPRHRLLLRLWLVAYAFVGIQLGWILRPFVGYPDAPVQFFRQDTWGNAYVIVAAMAWRVLARGGSIQY